MTNERRQWPLLEFFFESAEVATDLSMPADLLANGGDLFADIPVVGLFFKGLNACHSVRDRALAAKLVNVLQPFQDASRRHREKFKQRMLRDKDESRRIGEMLFLVLDRLTSLDKSQILGYLFIAYLNDELTIVEISRMAQAVDMCFAEDLGNLLSSEDGMGQSQEPWMRSLVPAGLAEPVGATMFDDMGKIYYVVTELGQRLRDAYHSAQATC